MAFAPLAACNARLVAGGFNEVTHGRFFEYARPVEGEFIPFPGYELKLYCGPVEGEFRWAKVIASRAYVVVEEAPCGAPVVAKWVLRNHKVYKAA
jgi:hypothetical protein